MTAIREIFVTDILDKMRAAIKDGHFIPDERHKNLQTLADLEWTWKDVKEELLQLQYKDFWKGPEEDNCAPKSEPYWFFKKIINGKLIYIKFKVVGGTYFLVKLKSFHEDE